MGCLKSSGNDKMSEPFEFDVRFHHGGRSEISPTSVRRSPRLFNSPLEISVAPLKRTEKLQPRRKLVLDDREGIGAAFDRRIKKVTEVVNGDEWPPDSQDLEGYCSEDSSFSDIVVGETEIEGDLVGEELFSDYIDESLINVINNTLNQSCSQTKVSGNAPLLNVDDVNVEIGSEDELVSDDDNRSVVGSDDESGSHDVFDPAVDFEKPILLKVGLFFPSVKCSKCGALSHNIKSCKNAPSAPQTKNKGGRSPTNSTWVKASKKKSDAKKAKITHDQTILSQSGSQPSLD